MYFWAIIRIFANIVKLKMTLVHNSRFLMQKMVAIFLYFRNAILITNSNFINIGIFVVHP